MKTKQAIDWGTNQLQYSSTPRLDAEVLLAYAIHQPRTNLYTNLHTTLTTTRLKKFKKLIAQRKKSVPVAHLTGTKDFYNITFHINSHTLIPRPETEAIVTSAIELAREKNITIIHDIGTGCGNIAIALAKSLPKTKIVASDICKRALNVAEYNVSNHKLTKQIKLVQSDLTEHIKTAKLIVANLPYVPEHYKVSKDILFEPPKALFAGVDGLELYRKFFSNTVFQTFRGVCLIELGAKQFEPMSNWLKQHLPNTKIQPINDIDGTICGLKADFSQSLS